MRKVRQSVGNLLAVDVGLRTGLALFGPDGRLLSYRSRNLGKASRLRKAVPTLLAESGPPTRLALEGGGLLAEVWAKEAARRGIEVLSIPAEVWRPALLLPRRQRSGGDAKRAALDLAREIIEGDGAARPTSLTHDAAEAICVGFFACGRAGPP